MAQFSTGKQNLRPSHNDLYEVVMTADKDGNIINASSAVANLNIAMGLLEGYESIHRIGAVPAMSVDTSGSIWDVDDIVYPWHLWDEPQYITITLTDPDDVDPTHKIKVSGLDANYNRQSEYVYVTGTTLVTTKQYMRLNGAHFEDGVYIANAGDVFFSIGTLEDDVTDPNFNVVGKMIQNQGRLQAGIFTVPAGHTAFITKGNASCNYSGDGSCAMWYRIFGQNNFLVAHSFEVCGAGGYYEYDFSVPMTLPEKSDMDVRALARQNNTRITIAFDIILVDNDYL